MCTPSATSADVAATPVRDAWLAREEGASWVRLDDARDWTEIFVLPYQRYVDDDDLEIRHVEPYEIVPGDDDYENRGWSVCVRFCRGGLEVDSNDYHVVADCPLRVDAVVVALGLSQMLHIPFPEAERHTLSVGRFLTPSLAHFPAPSAAELTQQDTLRSIPAVPPISIACTIPGGAAAPAEGTGRIDYGQASLGPSAAVEPAPSPDGRN